MAAMDTFSVDLVFFVDGLCICKTVPASMEPVAAKLALYQEAQNKIFERNREKFRAQTSKALPPPPPDRRGQPASPDRARPATTKGVGRVAMVSPRAAARTTDDAADAPPPPPPDSLPAAAAAAAPVEDSASRSRSKTSLQAFRGALAAAGAGAQSASASKLSISAASPPSSPSSPSSPARAGGRAAASPGGGRGDHRLAGLLEQVDDYCFRFQGPTVQTIVTNEKSPFRRNQVVQVCAAMYVRPLLEMIPVDTILQQIGIRTGLDSDAESGGGEGLSRRERLHRTARVVGAVGKELQDSKQSPNFFSSGQLGHFDMASVTTFHSMIGSLIAGADYKQFFDVYLSADDPDVYTSRQLLASWRVRQHAELQARAKLLEGSPLASPECHLLSDVGHECLNRAATPDPLHFSVDLPASRFVKFNASRKRCSADATADELREMIFKDGKPKDASDSPIAYVLKVPKIQSYLVNEWGAPAPRRLLDFDYVRASVSGGLGGLHAPIPLQLVEKTMLDPAAFLLGSAAQMFYDPHASGDYLLARETADELQLSFADKLARDRDRATTATTAVGDEQPRPHWKCNDAYRLRVDCVDNIICRSQDVSYFVMAEVFHGGRRLCPPAFSSAVVPPFSLFTSEPSATTTQQSDAVTLLAIVVDNDDMAALTGSGGSGGSSSGGSGSGSSGGSGGSSSSSSSGGSSAAHWMLGRGRHGKSDAAAVPRQWVIRVRFDQWLTFAGLRCCDIPRGARVCVTVWQRPARFYSAASIGGIDKGDAPVGWTGRQIIDQRQLFRRGCEACHLWPNQRADPLGSCADNRRNLATFRSLFPIIGQSVSFTSSSSSSSSSKDDGTNSADLTLLSKQMVLHQPPLVLRLEFAPASPLFYALSERPSLYLQLRPSAAELRTNKAALKHIIFKDALQPLSASERRLLFVHRDYLSRKPGALAPFLRAVAWNSTEQVKEAYRLLEAWAPPSTAQALELLGHRFSDPVVRQYAVQRLEQLDNGQVNDYILQLTQSLKHEIGHDSPLALFLLRRARECGRIGQSLYWMLKVELDQPDVAERFTVLLEAYLRFAGPKLAELNKQVTVLSDLLAVARGLKKLPQEERRAALQQQLAALRFPGRFELPLDSRWQASGVEIEQCKAMSSKMVPLWLVFSNAYPQIDSRPHVVMLKVGDDLRQDALTLQMIRLMDKLWKSDGLDLRLQPYGCVPTGSLTGMLELVLNAMTINNIIAVAAQKSGGVVQQFVSDVLTKWLRQNNAGEEQFRAAQENFMYSCAGYCVATYVLGIGDRHSDNIMMSKNGLFFHIDFGHFLGHYKTKFGVERERAPFVFTKQMVHVLGGKSHPVFARFVAICCRAYNVLRANAGLLMNLFILMLPAGIPELVSMANIRHLRKKLCLHMDDAAAAAHITRQIHSARRTFFTLVDHGIHYLKHR